MRLLLPLVALALIAAAPTQAQEAASVTWALTEADGVAVSSTEGAATGIDVRSEALVVRSYSGTLQDGSGGPLGPFQRWWLDGAEWPVEDGVENPVGPNAGRYVEFVATPAPGGTFSVTGVRLVVNAGGTGEMDAEIVYDTDPAFASPTVLQDDFDVSREAVGTFEFTVDESLAEGDSLYVRVYPWLGGGNPSTGRYLYLQDVSISGTSTGAPPPPVLTDYVTWDLTEAAGTAVSETGGLAAGADVRSSEVVVRDYTGLLTGDVEGPLGPYQRWWLDGAEWPVEDGVENPIGPNPDRYVEFVVAPADRATLTVDRIALVVNAGGTGEMDASLFYDTDPAFSAPTALQAGIDVSRDAVGEFVYDDLEVALGDGDSLYVRVYPWLGGGNPSTGRYLFLQDVTVSGTGEALPPEPVDGVYWALTEADTTSVTNTGENLGGASVRGVGVEVRSYSGVLSDDSEGPLGPFQRWWTTENWPDEDAPNAGRYVEFAAGAAEGYEVALDSLSLYLNGGGTGNMTASLYYSTDPAFADSVAIAEGVAASRDALGYLSYDLDGVTVPEGDSVYVRVYPYLPGGSTSEGKYLFLQDVLLAGRAVLPRPTYEADGVFWPLTEAYGLEVAAASEDLGGASARGSNIEVRDYDGDLRDAGDAPGPLGLFQRWWLGDGIQWPVQDGTDNPVGPTADRYVEFAAGPAEGRAFRVDSVSVYVHGDGTSEMRAALYYSTDPAFADSVALEESFAAGDGDFGGPTLRTYEVDLMIAPGDTLYVRAYPWLGGGNPSVTRYFMLQAMTFHGEATDPVAAEDGPEAARAVLHPSAPNPVRSASTLRYELAEAADAEVSLVNVLGQRVATLASGPHAAGAHEVTVEAGGLAAGVYFVRLVAGGEALTRQIVVAR